jgi:hypothetical protein
MNRQLPTSQHALLVMMFVLVLMTLIKTLILLQCYVMLSTIQSDVRLERKAVAARQRDIMTRLASIEICVDVTKQGVLKVE